MKRLMREKPGGVELSSLNYKYEHRVGYLVAIEIDDVNRIGLDVLKDACGFELTYKTNENSCWMFKDARCLLLDEEVGDVKGLLLSMEAKVYVLYTHTHAEFDSILLTCGFINFQNPVLGSKNQTALPRCVYGS